MGEKKIQKTQFPIWTPILTHISLIPTHPHFTNSLKIDEFWQKSLVEKLIWVHNVSNFSLPETFLHHPKTMGEFFFFKFLTSHHILYTFQENITTLCTYIINSLTNCICDRKCTFCNFGPLPICRARRDIQFWGVNFSIWRKIDWVMAISSFRLTNCIITSLYRRFCPITARLSAPFLTVNNFEAHSIHPSHKIPKLGVLVHWPPVSVRRSNLIGSLSKSCILIGHNHDMTSSRWQFL